MKTLRIIAIVLLFFNGIGALFGGFVLLYDPTGGVLQLPINMLQNTPFTNFLIPGIILFLVNGVGNILVAIFTIVKYKNYQYFIMLAGVLLGGWIVVQVLLIQSFYAPLHLTYLLLGILLIICGVFLNKYNKQIS